VYPTLDALSHATARAIVDAARESVRSKGGFSLVLSGGETPRPTYELLANRYATEMPWELTDVFFSDERFVPSGDHRNNVAMTRSTLLSRVPIPEDRVHAILTEGGTPAECASRYEEMLRVGLPALQSGDEPTFDFALLGVGADGHTASLFPGDAALRESSRWVLAVHAPAGTEVRDRITLTLPVLNRSRRVVFLVAGKGKSVAVAAALRGETDTDGARLPAALVHGVQTTEWLLDAGAAGA
jgi:6-phosphogluconolactonase